MAQPSWDALCAQWEAYAKGLARVYEKYIYAYFCIEFAKPPAWKPSSSRLSFSTRDSDDRILAASEDAIRTKRTNDMRSLATCLCNIVQPLFVQLYTELRHDDASDAALWQNAYTMHSAILALLTSYKSAADAAAQSKEKEKRGIGCAGLVRDTETLEKCFTAASLQSLANDRKRYSDYYGSFYELFAHLRRVAKKLPRGDPLPVAPTDPLHAWDADADADANANPTTRRIQLLGAYKQTRLDLDAETMKVALLTSQVAQKEAEKKKSDDNNTVLTLCVASLRKDNETLRKKVTELETNLARLTKDLQTANAKLQESTTAFDELLRQLQAAQSDLTRASAELQRLENTHVATCAMLETQERRVAELTAEVSDLEQETATAAAALLAEKETTENQQQHLLRLRTEHAAAISALDASKQEASALESDNRQLRSQLDASERANSELATKTNQLAKTVETSKLAFSTLESNARRLAAANAELAADKDEAAAKFTEELRRTEGELALVHAQLQMDAAKLAAQSTELKQLKQNAKFNDGFKTKVREERDEATRHLETTARALSVSEKRYAELREAHKRLADACKSEGDAASKTIETTKKTLLAAKEVLDAYYEKLRDVKDVLYERYLVDTNTKLSANTAAKMKDNIARLAEAKAASDRRKRQTSNSFRTAFTNPERTLEDPSFDFFETDLKAKKEELATLGDDGFKKAMDHFVRKLDEGERAAARVSELDAELKVMSKDTDRTNDIVKRINASRNSKFDVDRLLFALNAEVEQENSLNTSLKKKLNEANERLAKLGKEKDDLSKVSEQVKAQAIEYGNALALDNAIRVADANVTLDLFNCYLTSLKSENPVEYINERHPFRAVNVEETKDTLVRWENDYLYTLNNTVGGDAVFQSILNHTAFLLERMPASAKKKAKLAVALDELASLKSAADHVVDAQVLKRGGAPTAADDTAFQSMLNNTTTSLDRLSMDTRKKGERVNTHRPAFARS